MDWLKPSQNPRMVKLRRFEPGRVQGTLKKSEMEQGRYFPRVVKKPQDFGQKPKFHSKITLLLNKLLLTIIHILVNDLYCAQKSKVY